MSLADRLGLVTRSFCLATVLVLGLTFRETEALQGTLLLAVLGAVAFVAARAAVVAPRWLLLLEGLVAALVIGGTLPEGGSLLPYLVVPALLTGVLDSYRAVLLNVAAELLGLVVVLLPGGSEPIRAGLEQAAPWALAGLGAGLLAAWTVDLRSTPRRVDEESYESAKRLLGQLRTVARRLSSGLDPVSMANHILSATHEALADTRTGVYVATEGGRLVPLGFQGYHAGQTLLPEGELVDRCWAEAEPVHMVRAGGLADTRHRVALPLRSGARMLGVVLSEAGSAPPPGVLTALMRELDEQALRLDTALVFDEVRTLATREERQRLAREIHDGVAQEIASLGYAVDDLRAEETDELQRERLGALRSQLTRIVSELRLSIFDLRSDTTPAAGLGSALSDYVRDVGARSGLTVHLTLDEAPTRLRGEVETELLRIAQEAVTNARKHARAENLWVDCRIRPPYARIVVEDDGQGLGTEDRGRADSYGFTIMRERAERVGAVLEIGPRDVEDNDGEYGASRPNGTKVAVTVGVEPGSRS